MEIESSNNSKNQDDSTSSFEPSETSSVSTPPDSPSLKKPAARLKFSLNYQKVQYNPLKAKHRKALKTWIGAHFKEHIAKPLAMKNIPFFFECCNALVSKGCENDRDHDQSTKIGWKVFSDQQGIKTEQDFLRYFLSQKNPERQVFPSFNTYHRSMAELKAELEQVKLKVISQASHIERMKHHIDDTLEEKDLVARNQARMEEIYLQREKKLHEEIIKLKAELKQSQSSGRSSLFRACVPGGTRYSDWSNSGDSTWHN